jgi:hypothetical protein
MTSNHRADAGTRVAGSQLHATDAQLGGRDA